MTSSLKPFPVLLLILVQAFPAQTIQTYIQFDQSDSSKSFIEVPDSPVFSESTTGSLTVASWIRPSTLDFKYTEGNGYVNWLGKGVAAVSDEWIFRMYNSSNDQNRVNRISFYVFNLTGGEGIGSYFQYPINTQNPVRAGEWIFVVGVVDGATNTTSIYKDGSFVRCDKYYGDAIVYIQGKACQHYPRYDPLTKEAWIVPRHGTSPLHIGRSDSCCPASYWQGGMAKVRIWNRALNSTEIQGLYSSDTVPQQGLVAQYLLNENSGAVVHDSVGGRDGKMLGTSWRWVTAPSVVQTTISSTLTTTSTQTSSSSTTAPQAIPQTTVTSQTTSSSASPTGLEAIGVLATVVVIAIVAVFLGLRRRSR